MVETKNQTINIDGQTIFYREARKFQPPTLVVWGRNDYIFLKEGGIPYQRDLKDIEVHLLDTGHFALEEEGELIAELISHFLTTRRYPVARVLTA